MFWCSFTMILLTIKGTYKNALPKTYRERSKLNNYREAEYGGGIAYRKLIPVSYTHLTLPTKA